MRKIITTLVGAGAVVALGVTSVAYVGLINVAADDPHWRPVQHFLSLVRERSIAVRTRNIQVPALDDPALISAGAGNYNAMCIGCHLAPGVAATELSQNLYPPPPDLTDTGAGDNPAITFWVIKHGIKATGMPAWGKSMADPYLWGLVAFLQQMPSLDAQQYQTLVASSAGHQHGGGESRMHDHQGQHGVPTAAGAIHHQTMMNAHHAVAEPAATAAQERSGQAAEQPATVPTNKIHIHTDGNQHVHNP